MSFELFIVLMALAGVLMLCNESTGLGIVLCVVVVTMMLLSDPEDDTCKEHTRMNNLVENSG